METKLLPSSKINPTKLLGGSFASPKNPVEDLNPESINVSKSDLLIIKKRVFEIKDLVTSINTLKKKRTNVERKEKEREKFDTREKELESKKKPEDKKVKLPSAPKLGFLDIIKRFVVNVLIGFVAVRLIKHLPKLIEVAKFAGGALDFITDVGGKLLNGLATFIQKAYEAYDFTRNTLKSFGGENAVNLFDKFNGAIGNIITAALAASFALVDMMGDDGPGIMDLFGKKGAAKAVKTTAKVAKLGAAGAAAVVAGVGLLSSALGEGAFQLKKIGNKKVESAKKALDDEKNPFMKPVRWGGYQLARFLNFSLGNIGVLLDIVGTPFRYAIELIRYPFLSEEDKEKQSQNLAKFDARIREQIREGLNVLTLGTAFKEKGSFGNIFGNQGAQTEMMSKMSGGGRPVTRGGKVDSGPRRRITKSKAKRTIQVQPTQLKPGADVGGEEKIEKIFPKSKDKNEVSPLGYIEKTYENTNQDRLFGPLLNLQTKSLVGQKPNKVDYKNAAQGLSNWMTLTFSDEILRTGGVYAAGGGEINADMLSKKSGDMTDAIARSLEDNISKRMDGNIQDLMKQMMLKGIEPEVKGPEVSGDPGDGGGDDGDGEFSTNAGDYKELLDMIAGVESTSSGGYNAFNRGGSARGHVAHGSGNASSVSIGGIVKPLTQRTVREIMALQARGELHATGRYQIIKETLGGLMKGSYGSTGVSADDLYNADTQDKLGIALIKGRLKTGANPRNFRNEWIGLKHISDSKLQAAINKAQMGRTYSTTTSIPEVGGVGLQDLKSGSKNPRQIVFHWNAAGGYNDTAGAYHTIFKGDGTRVQKTSYNNRTPGSLYRPNAINLAVAANPDKGLWPKSVQYNAMAQEVASLAKSWGWTSSSINARNVPGHGEVGSGKDLGNLSQNISTGRPPSKGPAGSQDNYGPVVWGGDGSRWDLSRLTSGQKIGDGENAFRNMIKQKMGSRFHGGFIFKDGKYNLHAGEFVVDKDSVDQVGVPFLATINSIENKTQLKQKIVPLIEHLEQFADYEEDYGENNEIEIVIEYPEPIIIKRQIFSNNIDYMVSGGSSIDYTQSLMSHA